MHVDKLVGLVLADQGQSGRLMQMFRKCLELLTLCFLQRVSIACYAKRCNSYRKSVRLSVRHTLTLSKRLKLRSWGLHCNHNHNHNVGVG